MMMVVYSLNSAVYYGSGTCLRKQLNQSHGRAEGCVDVGVFVWFTFTSRWGGGSLKMWRMWAMTMLSSDFRHHFNNQLLKTTSPPKLPTAARAVHASNRRHQREIDSQQRMME